MDAKPQRPFRPLRVRDENQPPAPLAGKVIHQRHKSSPAISAMMQNGSLKTNGTRTAFADVSNTVRNYGAKDDTAVNIKPVLEDVKEHVQLQTGKDQLPLSKPAQRPYSISGLKGIVLNALSSQSSTSNKPATVEKPAETSQAFPNIKRTLTKKANFIYREDPIVLPDSAPVPEKATVPAPLAPVERPVSPHSTESAPVELVGGTLLPLIHNENVAESEHRESVPALADLPIDTAPAAYPVDPLVPSLEVEPISSLAQEIEESIAKNELPLTEPAATEEESQAPTLVETKSVAATSNRSSMHSVVKHAIHPLPSVPEPEEYEPIYAYEPEIDEYTAHTRRSIRSLGGDYTTGATTVLMAPKVTMRTQQEIMDAKVAVGESRQCEDLEEDEHWDISMVAEYSEEIFDYMRRLEDKLTPNPCYMSTQTELSWSMRAVLIDWIVQVHLRFGLLPETLFLCVNYIDRFLSKKVVSVGKLQLVGATAIFIAAKFEEINCPSIQEIHYMVDGGYTIDEILKAERFMLTMLDFELGWPGPMSFLRRVSKADEYDLETRTLAKYFLELTIIDERFVGCPPSYTAAGAHCLARRMLLKGGWTSAHIVYSNYTYSQLEPLLHAMVSCLEEPEKHHGAVFDKYADKRFKRASTYVQDEMRKGFALPPTVQPLTVQPFCSGYFFAG